MNNHQTANEPNILDELKDLFIRLSNQNLETFDETLIKSLHENCFLLSEYFSDIEDDDYREALEFGMKLMYANENNLSLYCLLVSIGFNIIYNCRKAEVAMRKELVAKLSTSSKFLEDDSDVFQSIVNQCAEIQERIKQF